MVSQHGMVATFCEFHHWLHKSGIILFLGYKKMGLGFRACGIILFLACFIFTVNPSFSSRQKLQFLQPKKQKSCCSTTIFAFYLSKHNMVLITNQEVQSTPISLSIQLILQFITTQQNYQHITAPNLNLCNLIEHYQTKQQEL